MSWDKLKSKIDYKIGAVKKFNTSVRAEIRYRSQIHPENEELLDEFLMRNIHDKLAQNIADKMLADLGFKEDTAEKLKLVEDLSVESVQNLVELSKLLGRFSPEEIQRVITIYVGLYRLGEEKLNG